MMSKYWQTFRVLNRILLLWCAYFVLIFIGHSQCPFDPVIYPSQLILCPQTTDTLWTQEYYEAYQWYRDGVPIQGANQYFLVVDYVSFSGSYVQVEATLDGCSEMSNQIFVDGYVFLPPVVSNTGNYSYMNDIFQVCTGDTIMFTLLPPYDTLIQWFEDNMPIPGQNTHVLILTSEQETDVHVYHVQASPSLCPNFVQQLGVPMQVQFINCAQSINAYQLCCKQYVLCSDEILQFPIDASNLNVMIFSSDGRTVKTLQTTNSQFTVNCYQLPEGFYYVYIAETGKVLKFVRIKN